MTRDNSTEPARCRKCRAKPSACIKTGRNIKLCGRPGPEKRDLIAIGSSTGGPDALKMFIPLIPKDINAGIVIVQHMPCTFTGLLAEQLNDKSEIEVREAKDFDIIKPGLALIAAGGYHMVVKPSSASQFVVTLNKNAPENNCRPSADVLFRSVAQYYEEKAVGVILTGMGCDGMLGLKAMKEKGSPIIAQDEKSCVVWGMPRSVSEAGLADSVVDIKNIYNEICRYML